MTPPNRPDVTFYSDEYRFSVRCSVFLRNAQGEVLVQKKKTDNEGSWALPGGRLKVGESLVCGVSREITEEFAVATSEHRFLGVIEQNIVIGEQSMHEHNFIYSANYDGAIMLCDDSLDWQWMPFEKLDTIKPVGCGRLLDASSSLISNGFFTEAAK
ncbi:NUDIX domain-containing protein [Pseudomonas aeruginosa]|uniref:NUDIX hydrolase n=1 Tax=Pseudomonas aeruginosa TaxID=287 RepID=UPI0009A81054|nr:NUDIX domain-containing protein [Pseudomonas aeruginosa]MBG6712932.1 NUDIX domain-containing protein [Pseudomonas aeruginosa]MBG7425060.1 NUDIX domain-containing protein [Pseudomonas aeruginosa]NNB81527.1 NUDIX domain-containing protein [Pseudomonas aeruginosa]RUB29762.1 NUDIX domain-containing protein [Pseudomonas aeruginosa]HCD6627966.1 NUDIX domain-containing protein [Pseudomonas aeruginosa]